MKKEVNITMRKEIGKRIKFIRETKGMNKEDFGKSIGISGQYLGAIENGIGSLTPEKLNNLCEFSNYSSDFILFGKNTIIKNKITNMFEECTNEDILNSFETLQKIALYIKNNNKI